MKINDKLYGFTVTGEEYIGELDAKIYEMTHEKSGARLAFLDREDDNKTFAVSFTTIPTDSTGVFHILEHSVLCGSEKYPVKEPFVELLKGSLNTFLNAMTYEDRTVYPVASRCDKDFYNLVSVYLDAVFHPMATKNECIFRQEGWHYEPTADGFSYNGVVYNEMKGAYSSPDDLGDEILSAMLYPTTLYGHDSGGNPANIPDLTFRDFCAAHERFYHPSNAKIFLDGSVNLGEILTLLDTELSRFDRCDIDVTIPAEPPIDAGTRTVYFDATDGDKKARMLLGTVYSDYSDSLTNAAMSLVASTIASSNDSPLKKAIIDSGLCEDFSLSSETSRQGTVVAEFLNCRAEDFDALCELYDREVRRIAKEGIDKELLSANLDALEFKLREKDFGTLPKGVAFALAAFGSWNYGERPAHGIISLEVIEPLRKLIEGDYFEKLLLSFTVDCPHRARLQMLPDPATAEKDAISERERVNERIGKMTAEEIDAVNELYERLREWQDSEDSPENLDTLPTLSLSDVTSQPRTLTPSLYEIDGARVLHCDVPTAEITYVNLHFDISDLTPSELFYASLLAATIVNLPTEKYTPIELQKEISANLGSMYHTLSVNTKDGVSTPVFTVHASSLDKKLDKLIDLVEQTLLHTVFSEIGIIKNIVMQTKSAMEDSIAAAGSTVAIGRALAAISEQGAIKEYLSGYECYKMYKACSKDFDGEKIANALTSLASRIFTKKRLTLSYTGKPNAWLENSLVEVFADGEYVTRVTKIAPTGVMSEGIITPSKVAYAVIGASVDNLTPGLLGALRVARSALSYEYLWNEIRVKGGAYGTGFVVRKSGGAAFYSYRDPSPENSLLKYRGSGDYLRALADSGTDLTKFIIGAIGEYDILTTPRTAGEQAVFDYLNGWSVEMDKELRDAMVNTGGDEIRKIADIIDKICDTGAVSVVGGREKLTAFEKPLRSLLEI